MTVQETATLLQGSVTPLVTHLEHLDNTARAGYAIRCDDPRINVVVVVELADCSPLINDCISTGFAN